jgi:hypothetical protein
LISLKLRSRSWIRWVFLLRVAVLLLSIFMPVLVPLSDCLSPLINHSFSFLHVYTLQGHVSCTDGFRCTLWVFNVFHQPRLTHTCTSTYTWNRILGAYMTEGHRTSVILVFYGRGSVMAGETQGVTFEL